MTEFDTKQLVPDAWRALEAAACAGGNPSSLHRVGQKARRVVDDAVAALRQLVRAPRHEVIFTGSRAEASALGILGIARARRHQSGMTRVVLPSLGHPLADQLASEGFDVVSLNDATDFDLSAPTALLCLGWPLPSRMVDQARASGIPIFSEAPLAWQTDVEATKVDALAVASTALGGPPGVAALVVSPCLALEPLWLGGGQERGLRPGTHATPLIAAMGAAANYIVVKRSSEGVAQ